MNKLRSQLSFSPFLFENFSHHRERHRLVHILSEFSIIDVKSNVSLIEGKETERFVPEESEQTFCNEDDGSRTVDSCFSFCELHFAKL